MNFRVRRARRILMSIFATAWLVSGNLAASPLCSAKIFVHASGAVEFDGASYPDTVKLKPRLVEYRKSHPDCVPSVTTDKKIRFATVGKVIILLQEIGFLKVGFLTEPSNP